MKRTFDMLREQSSDYETISLSGAITEESSPNFMALFHSASRKCVFNFKSVDSINSSGLRVWMLFLRDFVLDHEVVLIECPPVIVNQMNMMPSFAERAEVGSVYVPYYCEQCKLLTSTLTQAKDFPEADESLGQLSCPRCQQELTVEEEGYFNFVRYYEK